MENCLINGGVWLLFGKMDGPKTITVSDALEEAHGFCWINGQMQSLDDKTYKKYFSQRRENSKCSGKKQSADRKAGQQGIMVDYVRIKIENLNKPDSGTLQSQRQLRKTRLRP